MTSIKMTKEGLNGYFQTNEGGTIHINKDYLNESVELMIYNNENLYNKIKNKRIKATSIIWEGFIALTNDILKRENNRNIECSSSQLKSWLKDYDVSYEIFDELKQLIEEDRKELV